MATDANSNGQSMGTYTARFSMGAAQATMVVWGTAATLYEPQFVREKAWKRSRAGVKKDRCEAIAKERDRARQARKQRRKARMSRK